MTRTPPSPAELLRKGLCPNCGHDIRGPGNGGHYVPPSAGDIGGYACASLCSVCRSEDDQAIRKHMAREHGWSWRMLGAKTYEELLERDRQLHLRL
jgi:hypothetical protein